MMDICMGICCVHASADSSLTAQCVKNSYKASTLKKLEILSQFLPNNFCLMLGVSGFSCCAELHYTVGTLYSELVGCWS